MSTDREQWVRDRKKGIGGSDVAAILGLDPYKTPAQLWLEKVGETPVRWSPAIRRGHFLEPAVLSDYERKVDPAKMELQVSLVDEWRRSNLDALATTKDGNKVVVEVKTVRRSVRRSSWGSEWTDEVPDRTLCQAYWYANLADADVVHVVACVIPDDPDEVIGLTADEVIEQSTIEMFEVRRHPENESMILREAERFWRDHVVARVPPSPTAGRGDYRELWPHATPEKVMQADEELLELIKAYDHARRHATDAKKESDRLAELIKIRIEDREAVLGPDGAPIVTAKDRVRKAYTVRESTSRPLVLTKHWRQLNGTA